MPQNGCLVTQLEGLRPKFDLMPVLTKDPFRVDKENPVVREGFLDLGNDGSSLCKQSPPTNSAKGPLEFLSWRAHQYDV